MKLRYNLTQQGTGAGAAAGDGGQVSTAGGGTGGDGNATGAGQGATPPATPNAGDRLFTQAEMDAAINARLERDREAQAKKAAKQAEDAKAEALTRAGDFEKLADERKARIEELEREAAKVTAQAEQIARYQAVIDGQVKALSKDLPLSVTALLEKLDPADRLDWLTKNAGELAGTGGQRRAPDTNTRTSGGGTGATRDALIEQAKAEGRRSATYVGI